MKSFIIIIIAAAILTAVTLISGQDYQYYGVSNTSQRDTVTSDLFLPGAYLNDSSMDDYYYTTYEITKLEWEVNQLASFCRGELLRGIGFSSDKYRNLNDKEKKSITDKLNSYSISWRYDFKSEDKDSKKSMEQYSEEYFNRFIAPFISGDKEKTADKEKLQNEIRNRLGKLFELKEKERQNRVTRLEKELTELKASVIGRDKNKTEIIEQRLNKLVGVPSKLKW